MWHWNATAINGKQIMNYQKIYDSLIQKRQKEKLDKEIHYCEFHHIKPKSIYPELELDKSNIIALTPREHFIAHLLLRQIYKKQFGENSRQYHAMLNACWYLIHATNKIKINSKQYEKLKIEYSIVQAKRIIGSKNPMFGKKFKDCMTSEKYEQWCKNISKGHMRNNLKQETLKLWSKQRSGKGNPQYGVKPIDRMDSETYAVWKQKQSDIRIGEKNPMFGKSSWEKCSKEEREARIERYKNSMKGKTNKGKRCMSLPGDSHFKMVKKEDIQKYLDLGYIFYTKKK